MVFIEIGNSSVKAVRVTGNRWIKLFKIGINQDTILENELSNLSDDEQVILSSVRKEIADVVQNHSDRLTIYQITTADLGIIKLNYKTPESLGIDRVLACLGAAVHSKGQDVIVVDAGTACTIDYMTKDYTFNGGVIMPGLAVYRKAIKNILPELPDVKVELPGSFPGRSTDEAIRWGLYGGFLNAIQSFIELYKKDGIISDLYMTGGDGELIAGYFKDHYKCIYKDNLVFKGMSAYLKINDITL